MIDGFSSFIKLLPHCGQNFSFLNATYPHSHVVLLFSFSNLYICIYFVYISISNFLISSQISSKSLFTISFFLILSKVIIPSLSNDFAFKSSNSFISFFSFIFSDSFCILDNFMSFIFFLQTN